MTVRTATPDDIDVIIELVRELAEYEQLADQVVLDREVFSRHLFGDRPAVTVLLAEDDGEVVGYALWFPTFSTFLGRPGIWLEDVYLRPAHRGKGHGLALLQAVRDATDGRVEWSVLDWNEPSIRFYQSLGAEPNVGWTTYRWDPDPA